MLYNLLLEACSARRNCVIKIEIVMKKSGKNENMGVEGERRVFLLYSIEEALHRSL